MLNQLAYTLERPCLVVLGNGDYELHESMIVFDGWDDCWSDFPENPTVWMISPLAVWNWALHGFGYVRHCYLNPINHRFDG